MKFLLPSLLLAVAAHASAQIDMLTLREAARSRDLPRINQMLQGARGEVLEVYPQYYWYSLQLAQMNDSDLKPFFDRFEGMPMADRLRSDWLKELGRRQDWLAFDVHYAKADAPSVELQCLAGQSALAKGDLTAAVRLRPLWFSDQSRPESCGPVFDALFDAKQLDNDDVWVRVRMLLAANKPDLARQFASRVGTPAALAVKPIALAANSPDKALPKLTGNDRGTREAALFAIQRLARNDLDKAAGWLEKLGKDWPEADRRYGWQELAQIAARQHAPQASDWFERGGMKDLDEAGRFWAVRAALLAGDQKAILARINAMPADDLKLTVWRYWRAMALRAMDRHDEATPILADLAGGEDYYSLLARDALGSVADAPSPPITASEEIIRTVQQRPGIQRALALYAQDWRVEGQREWAWALRGLTPSEQVGAAIIAERNNLLDRMIYAAERTPGKVDPHLKYPTPHKELVQTESRGNGLDAAWVYGLIRQESRFMVAARSGVGASGLMQLMPATARWVASKLGIKHVTPADLNNIETNVRFGAFYLGYIQERLEGHAVLATAGYNAGPGRARNWQGNQPMDARVYIETIPFDETRDYVKKVMANAQHYGYLLGEPLTISQRLATIPPKGGSIDAP
ncbi:soluble lytic murein transglycosylase [Andreprevotia lacus DSM 23236]|jgi:soluble lytic murein transglycosylase|uniref:Soluble lytic murein transglycosylase n=1 Tax=Andreprevotia lacus DSM 23236 TaxID=1121001 RepID=A0A1W1XTI9_9NEIS|nr:lytic transglycosylase domain-containing protein [Andreprevotia lacus]SMC26838.1 soluble lytic murein transglycosylase [Andreprevotia lacus DSM 23236]